jgi:hypothetical protein
MLTVVDSIEVAVTSDFYSRDILEREGKLLDGF